MPAITLMISMDERGQVSVNGPLQNKILCYGLLSTAHDIIKDLTDKQASAIIAPTNGDMLSIKRT